MDQITQLSPDDTHVTLDASQRIEQVFLCLSAFLILFMGNFSCLIQCLF